MDRQLAPVSARGRSLTPRAMHAEAWARALAAGRVCVLALPLPSLVSLSVLSSSLYTTENITHAHTHNSLLDPLSFVVDPKLLALFAGARATAQ